ncbi:MAG: hypothetical protein DMG11_03340 [Acidobacteria bacterium]|nr:MAG: hypothetical protein DMG11_03340 [Acidobacteriota bacterium]
MRESRNRKSATRTISNAIRVHSSLFEFRAIMAPLEHPMKSNCLEYARIISNVGGDGEWMTTFA